MNLVSPLSGSAVGSCLVAEEGSWNLGVVQISPQVTANGSLSLVYINGDKCGNQNQRFSTRITLECSQISVRPPPSTPPHSLIGAGTQGLSCPLGVPILGHHSASFGPSRTPWDCLHAQVSFPIPAGITHVSDAGRV